MQLWRHLWWVAARAVARVVARAVVVALADIASPEVASWGGYGGGGGGHVGQSVWW